MIDLLWLLLPVAAASGWLAARREELQEQTSSSQGNFKGLNYRLNEEPDQAIDVFVKQVDGDMIESLMGLGIFFRRRGEVNQAIRIHQNLINKSTLEPQQRNNGLFELAHDYRSAGLLDRAEDLFQQLSASDTHKMLALRQLLELYQQEHDWEKAIRTAQQMTKVDKQPRHTEIAQYYCEQAEQYQGEAAQQAIQQALKADPNCVRASLLEGQLAMERQELNPAIVAFQRVEQQDTNYLSEVIAPLQTCYQQLGQADKFTQYLHQVLERYGNITPMLMLAKIIKQQQGELQAFDFIVKQLQQHPSVHGLDYLLDLAISNVDNITSEHLLLLRNLATQLLQNRPAYQCNYCGLTTKKLQWQCPSCQQWKTQMPLN